MIPRTRLAVALLAARSAARIGRLFGHSGTSLPGKVLLALCPSANSLLSERLPHGCVAVSATNGKTTTSTLVAGAMRSAGLAPVHNSAGANMAGGVAASLLAGGDLGSDDRVGLFEIDEAWLPELLVDLRPRAVVLGNLFRDQLDRYGEMDTLLQEWRTAIEAAIPRGTRFVACADDPGIASLAAGLPADAFRWFGVAGGQLALASLPHASDSTRCRACGEQLHYRSVTVGHLGDWDCPGCGARRPAPDYLVETARLDGARAVELSIRSGGAIREITLPLPGAYNAYNAIGAWALCSELGLPPDAIAQGLSATRAAFGRAESFDVGSTNCTLMLIKNPAGANEVVRTLLSEQGELDLLLVLNDGIADGRDVSWIWDADFDLLASRTAHVTCAGSRAAEMAVRLRYAGVPLDRIRVEGNPERALDLAAERSEGCLWVLPTYTALLELRSRLEDRGLVGAIE